MLQTQSTTITQKGQVTIPVEARRLLNLKKGDQIEFIVNKKKQEVTIKPTKRFSIMSLYGSLKPKVKYTAKDSIYEIIKTEEQAWPKAAAQRDRKTIQELHRQK